MCRKTLEMITIVAIISSLLCGCTTVRTVRIEEYRNKPTGQIVGVVTTSGHEIKVRDGHCQLTGNSLVLVQGVREPIILASDSVATVEVKRRDTLSSLILVAAMATTINFLLIREAVGNIWQ